MIMFLKRQFGYVILVVAGLMMTSCGMFDNQGTPEGYVRHCVKLLDTKALYADSGEWKAKKEETLEAAKTLASMEEAHSLVEAAAKVAGGKHSFLQAPVKDTASFEEIAPAVELLDSNIAKIVLPAHSGVKVSDSLYTYSVLNFLQEHSDAKGVILDLRGNRGGNMYPMIAAVAPLLPDDDILSFKARSRTIPISLEYIMRISGMSGESINKFPATTPIAILTDDWTGSSGEATLLCFRGLDNVRTFGIPTAGYASANTPYPLKDGYQLVITESCDMAHSGEVFCDDPIAPDVTTETPLEDAIDWIESL